MQGMKLPLLSNRLADFCPIGQPLTQDSRELLILARPERFELPTAWFEVSSTIANILIFNIDYWNARCPFYLTMQDNA